MAAEGADQVVRLVAVVDEGGGAEGPGDLQAGVDLRLQLGRRRHPLLLVGGIDLVAEAGAQVAVEGHAEVGGLLVRDQLEQEGGEAVGGRRRDAAGRLDAGGQGEVSPEDVRARVHQVDGGHRQAPKNPRTAADTASTSSLVNSGKTGRQSTSRAAAVATGSSPSLASTRPARAGWW